MWKRLACILLLCVLFASVPLFGHTTHGAEITEPEIVTMSRAQYNRLKEIMNQQEADLNLQEEKLNELKKNSTQQSTDLIACQKELIQLKAELNQTKEQLVNAKKSINDAEVALQKQKESLQTLTAKIKKVEHAQVVAKRQRDLFAGIALIAVGKLVL